MKVRCGVALALGGAVWAAAVQGAWAGPPPTADAAAKGAPSEGEAVTLPRLLAPLRPAYPEGASGEAAVQLEVVVTADGVVDGVRVVTGAPPFSGAAMAAVASARFEPARRGSQAITARFLLDVRFTPPVVEPATAGEAEVAEPLTPAETTSEPGGGNGKEPGAATLESGPSAGGPGPPKSGVDGGAIDVTVEGEHGPVATAEPAGVRLTGKAVSRVPGAFGDAFRAVEILPGVVPFLSGLPYFYVRGATPTTTGYFLDGVPVPLLFHVGVGPSVLAPGIIAGVDFYPGGYPAAFGRQVGGVLSAETVTPPARFSAEATLRVLDAGAYVTAPLPGERGSAFAAGRFSFTQAVLPLITKDVNLGYWDYQAGVNYRISEGNRVRLLAFGADDFLVQDDAGKEKTLYKGQFHRVDLALEHGGATAEERLSGALFGAAVEAGEEGEAGLGERVRARVATTFGVDRTSLGGQGDLVGMMGQLRSSVTVRLHRAVRARAGGDLLVEDRKFEAAPLAERPEDDDGSFAKTFASRTVTTIGGFAELRLLPASYVEIVGGVRADFFTDPAGAAVGVDPRGSARVKLAPWLASVTTFGMAHQRPSFVVPVPGLAPAGKRLVLQEALQVSEGLEFELPARVELRATGYLHEYAALTDFLATCGPGEQDCNFATQAGGRSYGLEVLLRRALTERLGGQVAYTLSRSERTVLGKTFAADTDRTHVLHLVLGYEFLPGWHAGARFTGYSGRPYSLVANDDLVDAGEGTLVGKRNVARTPGFFRVDVRLSKTWRVGKTGYVTAVLEGLNVTLSKETIDIDCRTPIAGAESCGPQEFGPVSIPSLGLSGGF